MIEDEVMRLFDEQSNGSTHPTELSKIDRQITEKSTSVRNLILAIEHGGQIDSLISSLTNGEAQLKELHEQRGKISMSLHKSLTRPTRADIGQHVSKAILQFEKTLGAAPIEEQKQLIRLWMNRIVLDGDENGNRASIYINRMPELPELKGLREKTVLSGPCRT